MDIRKLTWKLSVEENVADAIRNANDEVDELSDSIPGVTDSLRGTEDAVDDLTDAIGDAGDQLDDKLKPDPVDDLDDSVKSFSQRAKESFNKLGKGVENVSKKIKNVSKSLKEASNKTKGLSLASTGLGLAGVKSAMDYGDKLQFAGTQASMTKKEMEELSNYIVGMDKRTSSIDLMDTAGVYASAGLVKDEIIGIMNATEQVGKIAGDSNVASDLFLTSKVAFDLDLTDADAVQSLGDKFAKGSSMAKLEIAEMTETLKTAQGTFKSMNMDVTDSAATMVLLAEAGYVGSEAGTMINSTYRDLINKAEKGKVSFGKFKLSLYDANGEMKSMPQLMAEIEDGLGDMSNEQKNAAIAAVFGANSQKAVNAFLGRGKDAYKEYADEVGGATDDLKSKYDSLGESTKERMEGVKATVGDALINLGEAMLPAVESVASVVEKIVDKFNNLDEGTQKTIGQLIIGFAALSPALSIGSKFTGVLGSMTGGIGKFLQGETLLNTALGNIPGLISGIGGGLKTAGSGVLKFSSILGKGLVVGLKTAGSGIVKFGSLLGTGLIGGLKTAGSAVITLGSGILKLGSIIGTGLIGALKTAGGALVSFGAKAFGFVAANPMVLVAAGAVAAGVAIVKNWDTIKDKAGELKQSVTQKWSEIKANVTQSLELTKESASRAWDNMKTSTSNAFNSMKNSVRSGWSNMKSTVSDKIQGKLGLDDSEFESVKASVSSGWETLKGHLLSPLMPAVGLVKDLFDVGRDAVTGDWNTLGELLSNVLEGTVDLIKDKFEEGVALVEEKWEGLKTFLRNPIKGTVSIVQSVTEKVKSIGDNFAVGSTRIPKDMPANVHKDETILPASTARKYRALGGTRHRIPVVNSGSGSSGNVNPQVTININGGDNPRAIAKEVRREIDLYFRKLNLQRA